MTMHYKGEGEKEWQRIDKEQKETAYECRFVFETFVCVCELHFANGSLRGIRSDVEWSLSCSSSVPAHWVPCTNIETNVTV